MGAGDPVAGAGAVGVDASVQSPIRQRRLAAFFKDPGTLTPARGVGVYAELRLFQRLQRREPPDVPLVDVRLPGEVAEQVVLLQRVTEALFAWYDQAAWGALTPERKADLLDNLAEKLGSVQGLATATRERQEDAIRQSLWELLGDPPAPGPEEWTQTGAIPLGRLASDHAGYLSFDLARIAGSIPVGARVAPTFSIDGKREPIALLNDAHVSDTTVLGVFEASPPAYASAALPSVQSPSLEDWLLSPASFAMPSAGILGDNVGDAFFPPGLGTHSFTFRQVVRLTGSKVVPPAGISGYVDEYEVTWYPIGHSLGEIVHSTGLAPGESVRLAVVDWSWASSQSLGEKTSFGEELEHELHRDRLISESMESSLREVQRGGSVTGGVSVGVAPVAASVGGSYSTSSGSRRAAAETAQRVSDQIGQQTTAFRELRSTVVVTARQEESESVQTRTFTNYNHAHTLTILHYQLVRHYRVVTKWVQRRPALLLTEPPVAWTPTLVLQERPVLEPACFDGYAKAGFDALERVMVQWTDDSVNPKGGPPAITQERDFLVTSLILKVEVTEEETSSDVVSQAILVGGEKVTLRHNGLENLNQGDPQYFNNDGESFLPLVPDKPFRWGDLDKVAIHVKEADPLTLKRAGLIIEGQFGAREIKPYGGNTMAWQGSDVRFLDALTKPGPDVPQPAAPKLGRQRAAPEDNKNIDRLMEHLQRHSAYYSRLVRLARDPDAVAAQLEQEPWNASDPNDKSTILDHVNPLPLETFGARVAYERVDIGVPVDDDVQNEPPIERLVTLPSRGVFTEGLLGHYSVAEEIDNTRFWKWEEHPIPISAPEIAPVQVATPTPQPLLPLAPSNFPAPVATVASVPELPAPTGLAPMLQLLGTPGLFNDMSGRKEVTDLLKGLSDNTVKLDEAKKKADEIRQKYGAELDKQEKELQASGLKAQTDVLMKQLEAEQAAATRRGEAEATKAETQATQQQLEAAKDIPPSYRPKVYQSAASKLAKTAGASFLEIPIYVNVRYRGLSSAGTEVPVSFGLQPQGTVWVGLDDESPVTKNANGELVITGTAAVVPKGTELIEGTATGYTSKKQGVLSVQFTPRMSAEAAHRVSVDLPAEAKGPAAGQKVFLEVMRAVTSYPSTLTDGPGFNPPPQALRARLYVTVWLRETTMDVPLTKTDGGQWEGKLNAALKGEKLPVEIGGEIGGGSNWSLAAGSTYRYTTLMYDPKVSPTADLRFES